MASDANPATTRRATRGGAELFIVDNSDEHWKALEYVRQWCEISRAIDIATGHFELGAFLALDGEWQKVDKIRLLIGGETSRQTQRVVQAALDELDLSSEDARAENPFLAGADAVVEGLKSGQIEIRVYRRKKFHAKAYITHARLDVVGSAALVGSSNFTRPGLTQNVELNTRFTGLEAEDLQAWFEEHWRLAEPVTAEALKVLERHTREYTPFEIYGRALQVLTADVEPSETEWEASESTMYPLLAPYQQQAYHGLKQKARQWSGGFLTDGVGLGKTFVGLMLAEYYAVRERKNVLILATKTGRDAVWQPELERFLPHLTGDFSNVALIAHTDLSRQNAEERVRQLADRADVIIVDEAHNFRNRGTPGDSTGEKSRSRWWRLQDISKGKLVFLLTATPINNRLFDFVHQAELFTGIDDGYFASIGIGSVQAYVSKLERALKDSAGAVNGDAGTELDLTDFEELIQSDKLLESLIIQNSRRYAVESAKRDGQDVLFTEQDVPRAVPYTLARAHGKLLDELDRAFEKDDPLFELPMYYPLAYWRGEEMNPEERRRENRQRQVVGLIRTVFLKRFESSVAAFAGSCLDLTEKIVEWLHVNVTEFPEFAEKLERWRSLNADLLVQVRTDFRSSDEEPSEEDEDTSDLTPEELQELEHFLDPADYDLPKMLEAAFEDLVQLQRLLERVAEVGPTGDDKVAKLLDLLSGTHSDAVFAPEFKTDKVLVFTEFADTARYLHDRLVEAGIAEVDRLDGSRKADRVKMIRRFAPFYNRVEGVDRKKLEPLRVLISTDVLSEGVNLQDAALVVNYDLHWNPVRLMQRIGRVDRRLDPATEKELDAARGRKRGKVQVRNFLPPDDVDHLLRLFSRVSTKVWLISKTLGIPGGKLLTEQDMLDDVRVFHAFLDEFYGEITPVERLRLEYQQLVGADPNLPTRLERVPAGASAAKQGGERAGLFVCQLRPALVRDAAGEGDTTERWSLEDGTVAWSFIDADGAWENDLGTIADLVRSDPSTPAAAFGEKTAVAARVRTAVSALDKDFTKAVSLPLDAPPPHVVCWMELR
jgi:hypothetical protein